MSTPIIIEMVADEFKELGARLKKLAEALEIIPVDEDDLRRMIPDYNMHLMEIVGRFQKILIVCIKVGVIDNPFQPKQPTTTILVDSDVIVAEANKTGIIPDDCQKCTDREKCFPPHTIN